MTPAARVQAAIEILERIETGQRPADQIVASELRARRYVGSKDRRAITDLVYALLRHRARLDWALAEKDGAAAALPAERPRRRMLAWLAAGPEEPQPESLPECLFDGSRYGPPPLSEAERALAAALRGGALDGPEVPAAVRAELPPWLHEILAGDLGPDAEAELAALNREAPLDLRVNSLKADRERARAALAEAGIAAEPTAWSPLGLRLAERRTLPATAAYRDGLIEVQDEASQIAALLVEAGPGLAVADLCAGAGGKSLALAAAMADRGRLVALDRDRARLERARPRLARAGVTCCALQTLSDDDDPWLAAEAGAFDRVLVDAPCSGSGAWRRNPDARWRLTPEALASLEATQAALLDSAATLLRPGGRLVYATCSLIAAENGAQIEALLGRRPDLALLPYGPVWRRALGTAPPDDAEPLTLTPARHGTDGFFVALLERRA